MMRPKRIASIKVVSSPKRKVSSRVSKGKKQTDEMTNRVKASIKGTFIYLCAGCNKPIKKDKYLLKACDKYWHENCLKCDKCEGRLGELGSTLYCKLNMNLCRQDYLELFGETGICSVCEKLIGASELVMRAKANIYHLECFACQLCNQRFCVGDRFYLCENKVVCQYDYEEHILPIQRSLEQLTALTSTETELAFKEDTTTEQLNLAKEHDAESMATESSPIQTVPTNQMNQELPAEEFKETITPLDCPKTQPNIRTEVEDELAN